MSWIVFFRGLLQNQFKLLKRGDFRYMFAQVLCSSASYIVFPKFLFSGYKLLFLVLNLKVETEGKKTGDQKKNLISTFAEILDLTP